MNDWELNWYDVTITLKHLSSRAHMHLHVQANSAHLAEELVRGMYSPETFCEFDTKKMGEE